MNNAAVNILTQKILIQIFSKYLQVELLGLFSKQVAPFYTLTKNV